VSDTKQEQQIIEHDGKKFIRTGRKRVDFKAGEWFLAQTTGKPMQKAPNFGDFSTPREELMEVTE